MAKITRISATLTARYSPASGAADAFWLDGRMPGPRDTRAVDITLDREDKNFFFSTFATQSDSKDSFRDIEDIKHVLEKTQMDIKYSNKNIDAQITDLAECGVGVSGRLSVQHEGVRQPFFAGIMVKNSEIAAVTMGRGCAYLYRNDTLYPLTKDDLPFEAIDHNGKNVPNIDVYCAGIAATVRYSNIAQLQVDDCFILCNREVMEAVSQREMLKILYDAYDQGDAAGMIITAAASKLPGTPLQIMIGFVESINEGEKSSKAPAFILPAKGPQKVKAQDMHFDSGAAAPVESSGHDNAFDENYSDDDGDEEYDDDNSPKFKKLALIAIIAIVVLACGYAIFTLVNKGDNNNSNSTASSTVTISSDSSIAETSGESAISNATSSTVQSNTTSSAAATVAPTKSANGLPTTHTIKKGELLSVITQKYYNSSANKYIEAVVNANKAKYPDFTNEYYVAGWEITIPVVN